MEQVTYEIPSPPEMTVEERNKLVRQAADTGLIILLKVLIPFYAIRYWRTRFYYGSMVWWLWFLVVATQSVGLGFEKQIESKECGGCYEQMEKTYNFIGVLALISSFAGVGAISGSAAKRARDRLNIDRKTAIAILPAISN